MRKITQDIINTPRSARGLKPLAYWAYRSELNLTVTDNKITTDWGDTVGKPLILGVISGCKFFMNSGSEAAIQDDQCTGYKHKFTATINEKSYVLDKMDDIVIFAETNEGEWIVIGYKYGLFKTSEAFMHNDNLGSTAVEFTSREGVEEPFSVYKLDANGDIHAYNNSNTHERLDVYMTNGSEYTLTLTTLDNVECYLKQPDGNIVAGTFGEVTVNSYSGVNGNGYFVYPNNESLEMTLTATTDEAFANTIISFTTQNIILANSGTTPGLILPNATEVNATASLLCKFIEAPSATYVYAIQCYTLERLNAENARTIDLEDCSTFSSEAAGELIRTLKNGDSAATLNLVGTSATALEIDSYLTTVGTTYTAQTTRLNNWTITF